MRRSNEPCSASSTVAAGLENLRCSSLNRLLDAGFVVRHNDPLRKQRTLYALADPYLQFHYAVLEPHRSSLRGSQRLETWRGRLVDTFGARVRGPVFEEMAREWVRKYADAATDRCRSSCYSPKSGLTTTRFQHSEFTQG